MKTEEKSKMKEQEKQKLKEEENQLKMFLAYEPNPYDVHIRSDVVSWVRNNFLNYWEKQDKQKNGNYILAINLLYMQEKNKSYGQIALDLKINQRTLRRYRNNFIDVFTENKKMYKLLEENKDIQN